jgi:uncharacterized protein
VSICSGVELLRLLVDKITDISSAYSLSLNAALLNHHVSLAELGSADPFASDAVINYRLSRIERRLFLDGELSAELALRCGRCLADMVEPLKESFSIVLNVVEKEDTDQEELELDDEQINSIIQLDGEIDLLPVLTEQLLLALPMQSLCSDGCLGLCPYCGIDLNNARCNCEPAHFNNRFGKLKDLKFDPS